MFKKGKPMRVFFLIIFSAINLFAQADIISTLKKIESGEIADAENDLKQLKQNYPDNPEVKFLDAVLTENGEEALSKYFVVYSKFPNSQFADAALYRVFSYYYALGSYNKAEKYLKKLKTDYPSSPYIKAADRTLPSQDFFIEKGVTKKEVHSNKSPKVEEVQYKYTVQAGAFLNKTNADNLKKKFQLKGVYSATYTKEVGGSLLNIVIVGKFKNKKSAKPILKELKNKYRLTGRVVPLK